VGLAYDRVLEDRVLVEAAASGTRRFRARPLAMAAFVARMLWKRLRGHWPGFGTAAASFGAPLSLNGWLAGETDRTTEALGAALMARIVQAVPVVPVPLVAAALAEGAASREALEVAVAALADRLRKAGATMRLPPQGVVEAGLAPLIGRGMVEDGAAGLVPAPGNAPLLAFYAAPVLQWLEDAATPQT
jgi:glycerol-3-phosphate O-acyltransferase